MEKKKVRSKKLYEIDGEKFTINQLREGYRVITGENDKELTDKQIVEYMRDVMHEEAMVDSLDEELNKNMDDYFHSNKEGYDD